MRYQTAIFDLDGTLADCEHRRFLVSGKTKNWNEFFHRCHMDSPIEPVVQVLLSLFRTNHRIVILTGRSDSVMDETKKWLDHNSIPYHYLAMRPNGNTEPDEVLKEKMFNTFLADTKASKDNVIGVFDDRQKVVDMWRRIGLTCFQVAPGNF